MKNKIKKIHGHVVSQANKHQIKIRFLAVGVWNTVFGYLAFFFLESVLSLFLGRGARSYMPAIVMSNFLAMLMAYSLHRRITFKSTTKGIMLLREFSRFVFGNSLTVAISIVLLPIFVEAMSLDPKSAGFLVTIICTVISYFAHSRITFKNSIG